jgi:ADP-ribose pyrophosphatase YjhB (NUDIX family)
MVNRIPVGDDTARPCCPDCGYVHYTNPGVLVGVFLHHQDKILWIQRGNAPNKGLWTFPAGFVESGESVQEAAARELQEETGIALNPADMVPFGISSILPMHQVYLFFHCHCPAFLEARVTTEASDWGWFSEAEAHWDAMAYPESEPHARLTYQWVRNSRFPLFVAKCLDGEIFQSVYKR